MALNLRPDLTDSRALQTNQAAIERHLDDACYVHEFGPDAFTVDGTATKTLDSTLRFPVVSFPDAATSRARAIFRKPSEWRTGKLEFTVWYTAAVGSTNNFRIGLVSDAIRTGEVSSGTNLYLSDVDVPGPAVANTWLRYGPVYSTTSFGSDDQFISFGVGRAGTHANDVNTNPLLLLVAVVRHIPAEAVSQ